MIKSFADKFTEEIYDGIHSHAVRKNIPQGLVKEAQRRLDLLNAAGDLEALDTLPSMKNALVRDGKDKYSIPILDNWRIAFRWNNEEIEDVEIKS